MPGSLVVMFHMIGVMGLTVMLVLVLTTTTGVCSAMLGHMHAHSHSPNKMAGMVEEVEEVGE